MSRPFARWARLTTQVGAALLLTACGGSAAGTGMAGGGPMGTGRASTNSADITQTAAVLPPCPDLRQVPPRSDGLPPLRLPCLGKGPAVRLSDLRGTPTVVNVWAAWCTNCDREMPLFTDAQRQAGDRLRFFGVHYDADRGFALQSAQDFGVAFPSVHDGEGDLVRRELAVPGPPTTIFVRSDGSVAGRKIGEITSSEELDGLVQRYLGVSL